MLGKREKGFAERSGFCYGEQAGEWKEGEKNRERLRLREELQRGKFLESLERHSRGASWIFRAGERTRGA